MLIEKTGMVLNSALLWELLFIIIAKIVEVSLETIRTILTVKGYRIKASLMAIVELLLWAFVAARVIIGLSESPWKGAAYVIGYAIGIMVGSSIEKRLALGQVQLKVITSVNIADRITSEIRNHGFGATTLLANGIEESKLLLIIYANRKNLDSLMQWILSIDPHAMIAIENVNTFGGTIPSKKHSNR